MIFRKLFSKKTKSIVACATMATLLMTSASSVGASSVQSENDSSRAVVAKTNYRNVMYYGDWSIWAGEEKFFPSDIPVENLTHLNLAFMDFDKAGNLIFCDKEANIGHPLGHEGEIVYGDVNGGIVNELQVLRQKNPNLKIGTSLGGWSKSSNFTHVARDPQVRAKFVQNVMDFVKYSNFDFVDLDWEYPAQKREKDLVDNKNDTGTPDSIPQDKENYIKLLEDLRAALDKQGVELGKTYELSAALPMAHEKVSTGIDVKRMFELLDFGNIMTYDAAGAWDNVSGHQAALYDNPNSPYAKKGFSVDSSIKNYLALGAPSEKLVIGAAYYTRGWEKVSNNVPNPSLPGLYGEATQVRKDADLALSYGASNAAPIVSGDGGRNGGVWGWRLQDKLKAAYPGLKEYWDDTAKAPYMYSESSGAFFTYDNVRSIQEKVKYVKDNNLGGMIAWMASQDKPTSSSKRDELTNATKNALFGTGKLPTYEIASPANYAKVDVSVSKPAWGSGGELTVVLKNTATLKGTGGIGVSLTEEAAKTIKAPTLYIKTNGVKITGGEYPTPKPIEQDGYTVLKLDSYDSKLIKPGASITLKLTTDKVMESLNDLISIEMTQRMYASAPEFSKATLYGPVVNSKPVINASNKTIDFGSTFNPMDGVTASDKEDGNLTNKVSYKGTVNTNIAGDYNVTYSVTDSKGETTTKTIIITVLPKKDIITIAQVAGKYNSVNGDSRYEVKYDLNKDNIIDIYDIVTVSKGL
ncbi:glycosyl hydrolase family 18 protein [Clostridium sp. LP20]|uniref:glycosyl hydrolase family 18 protein n=1 Tax=Clostridium sp. LP20 TaxID=3418665 RepID=UPI003EE794B5